MNSLPNTASRESLLRAVDGVPWDHLAHAYAAALDAPMQLRRFILAEQSSDALEDAVGWMWGAILHQGSIYSASPPVIWILVDLLDAYPGHPAAEAIMGGVAALADAFLFMQGKGETSIDIPVRCSAPGEPAWEIWVNAPLTDAGGEVSEQYLSACRVRASCVARTVSHAVPVVDRCLDHPSGQVRRAAAAAWWSAGQAVRDVPNVKDRLKAMIGNRRFEPGVWLSAIIGLDVMGENVTPLLEDPDRRIRLGAAMGKGTAGAKSSHDELARALLDIEWLERTFPGGLAHRDMHLRFHVLWALLERSTPVTASAIVIDALGHLITQRASAFTADVEWGPILFWAFPERQAKLPIQDEAILPLPHRLDAIQRVVLDALTKKSDIWDRPSGNAFLALRRVQLPQDRTDILQCLAAAEA